MSGVFERSRSMRVGGPVVGGLLGAVAALGVHGRHAEADAGTDAGAGGVVGPGRALQAQHHHDSAHGPTPPYTTRPGPVSGPTLLDASALAIQNANISPIRFPGGKNPYLDRPLPPPPPPKPQRNALPPASIVIPSRPSTSSGPASDKMSGGLSGMPTRPNWDKRISRDDMYLTTRPIAPQKKGLQPYRIGVKDATMTSLPTPEPSPNAAPLSVPSSASIPARMPTPESLSSGEIQIGMALGSPVHAPSPQPTWAPQPPQAAPSPPPTQVAAPVPQRSKTQKRRLFGGLFGRKHTEPAPAASASTESVVSVTTTTTQSYASSSTPTRSLTVSESRNAPRHKPIVIRSNTAPMASPGSEDIGSPAVGTSTGGPSLLDVEIPDIRLERYSVMFSGLLNPQGTQATPSLLQRRQATLEKLKTINDNLDLELEQEKEKIRQRRATSPQPTKSPAGFTLFPSTPGREAPPSRLMPAPAATPRRLSPRSRSNTSPALLPSPSKPNFPVNAPPKKEKKTVKIVSPRTMDEQNRAANVERLREQQAQQAQQARQQVQAQTIVVQDKGFHFGPDESGLILDSPQSMDEEEVIHSRAAKPSIPEPQWQIISPPSSSASSVATKRSPSSASSVQTTVTRPSLDEGEAALQAAVEISIARQISVSRQQRQLLVPLQTNVAQFGTRSGSAAMARAADRSPNSAASASRSPINKLGRNERVAETKFSTPTLVVPKDSLENQLAQHRKSERVVLES